MCPNVNPHAIVKKVLAIKITIHISEHYIVTSTKYYLKRPQISCGRFYNKKSPHSRSYEDSVVLFR